MFNFMYIGHVKMDHAGDVVQCSVQIKPRIFLLNINKLNANN